MHRNTSITGLSIIAVGIFLLLGRFGVFSSFWSTFWPVFVLLPGIMFHVLFFGKGAPAGVLVPGGILTTAALIFFACSVFGWSAMAILWPGLVLGVAVGLFEAYYFDPGKPRSVLIASAIIGSIAAVFFGFTLVFTNGLYIVAVALIGVGMLLLFRRSGR